MKPRELFKPMKVSATPPWEVAILPKRIEDQILSGIDSQTAERRILAIEVQIERYTALHYWHQVSRLQRQLAAAKSDLRK